MNSSQENLDQEPDYGPYDSKEQALTDELLTLKAEYDNLNEEATLLVHEVANLKRAFPKQQMLGWVTKWWKAYILRPVTFNNEVGVWLMAMEQAVHEHGLANLTYQQMHTFIEAVENKER